jgi:uncharacterized damage-inducible protein DinB
MGIDFLSEVRRQLGDCATTIRHCLTQLDDSQVWWRPHATMNSIGNLVLHLAGNLQHRFLANVGGEPFDRNRFGEFTERRTIPRDELARRIDEVVSRVDALLSNLSPDRLAEHCSYVVTAGTIEGTVQALILRTLMHLAGHTQEIVFMARFQLGERYVFKNPAGVPPSMRSAADR